MTLKYVLLIMRADNDGEGGIMALIALLPRLRAGRGAVGTAGLVALGIVGASLFFGDSIITPAISVLSAVEGLEVVEPALQPLVVPISVADPRRRSSRSSASAPASSAALRAGHAPVVRRPRRLRRAGIAATRADPARAPPV